MNVILAVVVICSLVLTVQHSILAQVKSKQGSPHAMLQRLQQEIDDLKSKIAENPSSSKIGDMERKIQWNMRKIKEITPRIGEETERKLVN
jgi:peptidoglycan hydrolase CwlO-like protein